jgi:hypothetical protein
MIELTAKLLRGPVYLAGETIDCGVTFRNPSPPENTRSQSNRYTKIILNFLLNKNVKILL